MTALVRRAPFARAPRQGRKIAIVGVSLLAVGLLGQAAVRALAPASGPEPKIAARLDGGAIERRDLVYFPREAVADQSLRTFKPGPAWAAPAQAEPTPAPALAQAQPQQRRARFAAAPLPPARPAGLGAPADPPRIAAAPQRPAADGFALASYVPSGSDMLRRIGGLGATMRDSIGSVGTSLGKMIRISSR